MSRGPARRVGGAATLTEPEVAYTPPLVRTGREVSIFVHRDGQLLLTRRARDGVWHIPAGVVEDRETYRDAAARELAEETGLIAGAELVDLGCTQRYPPADHERAAYPIGTEQVILENFAAPAPFGWEPELDRENTQYEWVSSDEVVPRLHWDDTRAAFRVLRESLGGFR